MSNGANTSMSGILRLNMKLDELEMKLAQSPGDKQELLSTITITRESILPIRLELNNFIHMVSNLSDDKNGDTNLDKFNNVRDILFKLNDSIQLLSKRFGELGPLFNTVGEYTKEYKTKEYQPLETLGNTGAGAGAERATNTVNAATGAAATSAPASTQKKGRGSTASVKSPVSASNTPLTSTATAATATSATATAPAAATSTKKPRKPRQKKNTTSAKNTPAASHATTTANAANNTSNSVAATPLSATVPNTMNPTLSVPPQLMANLQNNIQGIPSPIHQNSSTGGMTPMPQQMPYGSNNNNTNRPNSVQQSPLHSNNTITPANILSMNMNMGGGSNGSNGMNMNNSSGNINNHSHNNQGPNAMNDFGNLDLNNIDLSSLNMDFL